MYAASKPIRTPGPGHPITIERNPNRVAGFRASLLGASSPTRGTTLTLREASYPPVRIHSAQGRRHDVSSPGPTTLTYCPYKGECAYYSIPIWRRALARRRVDLRELPTKPWQQEIQGIILAFYPGRVDAIEERMEPTSSRQ